MSGSAVLLPVLALSAMIVMPIGRGWSVHVAGRYAYHPNRLPTSLFFLPAVGNDSSHPPPSRLPTHHVTQCLIATRNLKCSAQLEGQGLAGFKAQHYHSTDFTSSNL